MGEDERPGHEGDTDREGQRRHQQAQLAGEQAPQGDVEHGQPLSFFIRSRTRSAVGWAISSTIEPSARKITRSAYDAATGSWVTITMVWSNSRTAWRRNPSSSAAAFESSA